MSDRNKFQILAIQRTLLLSHRQIGRLILDSEPNVSDILVACRTYINQALKELRKINE